MSTMCWQLLAIFLARLYNLKKKKELVDWLINMRKNGDISENWGLAKLEIRTGFKLQIPSQKLRKP